MSNLTPPPVTGPWPAWWEERLRVIRSLRAMVGILRHGFGHGLSARRHCPLDRSGEPLPWFTYPAIEYLAQFDLSGKHVFEYGAGNSTLFWGARCSGVVSVESDAGWHRSLAGRVPANVRLEYCPRPEEYAGCLARQSRRFDIIVVDGIERLACSRLAAASLAPGGLVILDNADWHPGSAAALRGAGLLQVDMSGFGPVNGYTWTTSLFFDRAFAFPTRNPVQPRPPVGGILQVAD